MAWSLLASLLALGTSEGGGAGGVSVELCRLAVAVRLRHGVSKLRIYGTVAQRAWWRALSKTLGVRIMGRPQTAPRQSWHKTIIAEGLLDASHM
jgi:hypothetical protein